jgi:hypothetical protein
MPALDDDPRDHDLELALLTLLFIRWYGTIAKAVHGLTVHMFNLGPVPLDDAAIRHAILNARAGAVAVDATTRKQIAKRIADGASRGLTPYEIAYGTEDFAGIDGLFKETWAHRSEVVAKTELQKAQLQATVHKFQTLGRGIVTGLLIHDGDYDAYCESRNGTVVPVSSAPDIAHPNCRLSVSPIFGP